MRKSPYRHPVREHIRAGIEVSNYMRGKGQSPRPRSRTRSAGNLGYEVTLYFDDGEESHGVEVETFTDASKEGLDLMETPQVPRRMRIRRRRKG